MASFHHAAKGPLAKAVKDLVVIDEAVPNCFKVVLVGIGGALRELARNAATLALRYFLVLILLRAFERFHSSLILNKMQ